MGFDCWFVVAISGNIIYSWGGHFSLYPILSLIDPPWPKSVSRNCLLMETQEQRLSHPLLKYSQPPEISKPDGIWHGATLLGSCHHMSYGLHFQKRKAVSFIQQPHTYNFRDLSGCSVSGDFVRDGGTVWPCHVLLADSTSFNNLSRKFLPWRCGDWLGGGWTLAPRKSLPLTHQASLWSWGDLPQNVAILSSWRRNLWLGSLLTNSNSQGSSVVCRLCIRHFTWIFFPLESS